MLSSTCSKMTSVHVGSTAYVSVGLKRNVETVDFVTVVEL